MNGGSPTASRVCILIVDDNPDVTESLRMLFESSGFSVAVAISGLAAIQYFSRSPPTVVLVDLGMPHINGFDLMKTLKASAMSPLLGIAMTGWTRPNDVAAARAAGFDHYFTKPMDTDAIEPLIRSFMRDTGANEGPVSQSTGAAPSTWSQSRAGDRRKTSRERVLPQGPNTAA